jgi:uridine monophosphate synthetase
MNFFEKLDGAIAQNSSLLCVRLDPDPDLLTPSTSDPRSINLVDRAETWLTHLIAQTADQVCAYKVIPEFYLAFGSEGLDLLERILKQIPVHLPVIFDAKYAHLNTSSIFAETVFQRWYADAVTLSPFAGQDQVAPFLVYPDRAVFVLCATANPSASRLQTFPNPETPFYLALVEEIRTWGASEQVALEVGGTPETVGKIRAIAPERLLLLQDTWHDDTELAQLLQAGCNANGDGLLLLIPKEVLNHGDRRRLIQTLKQQVNEIRVQSLALNPQCDLWLPDVGLADKHPYQDLVLQLYDLGCLKFGDYVQASGATFPYYIDLRTIISSPQVFDAVINAYVDILQTLSFDRIAGIPYGSLPTATGLSLRMNHPMIFPRKEVKAHGTRRLVEGQFHPGETVVVVDDVLISGNSAIEGAAKLESVGLNVTDIVVFINHEKGGVMDKLNAQGYQGHAVLTLSEIARILCATGRISATQLELLLTEDR